MLVKLEYICGRSYTESVTKHDSKYMQRCLDLAQLGYKTAHPNPMVGCVIVHEGKIIGEGYHTAYGKAHAEVEAINSVIDKSLLRDSTLYVNLEPCAHHGKTPPCADLIIRHQLKRVVIANTDPHEVVAGTGIERMKANGIEVRTGVLESEGRTLNRRFFTYHEKKRPYIILKWAQTADGYLGRTTGDSGSPHISGKLANQYVHELRASVDGIFVGTQTVVQDNPSLNVRHVEGPSPHRFTIDHKNRIPTDSKLLSDGLPTTIFSKSKLTDKHVVLDSENDIWAVMMDYWYKNGIQSVLIEGGTNILNQFIEKNRFDEIITITSSKNWGSGVASPKTPQLHVYQEFQLGSDRISIYHNNH